jgi:protein TonB
MAIERRFGPSLLTSLATHLACGALVFFAIRAGGVQRQSFATSVDASHVRLVWLGEPGPGGGGGGGGDGRPEPPRRAKLPGRDALTVAAVKQRSVEPTKHPPIDPPVTPQLIAPVATLSSGTEVLPGAMNAPPALSTPSRGPGTDGGTGTGIGTGDGPGRGRGLGDGRDRGMGGDAYRPGGDVTMPIEIKKGTPQYTADAMRARAQGSIMVECVVQTNGACANIRVKRSFDPAFGLDREAIRAAEQWRFRPGTRRGEPVPVLVTMEIAFALR